MVARTRWTALGLVALAAATAVGGVARSSALSASLRAAYRAFRDPTLVDAKSPGPPPAPATVSCARLDEKMRPLTMRDRVDDEPTRSLDRPVAEDLDDPEGATLAALALPDVHVPITRRTMRYVRFLARTDAGRTTFLQRYRRAGHYRENIALALREAGLPEDLLWVVAVESGFDPRAVSQAGAAGLWQFMPATGQLYGLDQSPFVDERRSIVRATRAAVTHLRDLYERFGRWDLALAAYNAGYERVAAAVERVAHDKEGQPFDGKAIDFAELAAARALPEETIHYVPQIMAFALVAANRTHFGLDGPELGASLELGEIAVPEGTRLRTVARAAGISVAVLRDYNPQLLRDRVPPIGGDYLVALPESRVQRALAAFPAYADQEVVVENDGTDLDGDVTPPLAQGLAPDPEADDPLPKRPVPLGRNRLPELMLPSRERTLVAGALFGLGAMEAKLPASLVMPDLGWRRVYEEDPLGLLGGGRRDGGARAPAVGSALEKQLGFLDTPPSAEALRTFSLPNGITVRVRRDKGAPNTAITLRIATVEDAGEGASVPSRLARRGAEVGAAETLHTLTVGKGDADAAIELAAARLRLSLGDTSATQLAEIRFRAGAARRKLLQETPYGPSWLALGEALFPPDHPLAGTVLGAGDDPAALRDMMIAEAMRRERALARASLTIVGDVDELRARKLAEAFLAPVAPPADAPVSPHPREDRISIEEEVPSARALVGWIGPGDGEVGDASLRVAVEVLENPKTGLLQRALVDRAKVASSAHAALEVWPRASVAAVEIAPATGHDVAEAVRALDAEITRLADEGPSASDVAMAKWFVHARLQKENAAATAAILPGNVHSAGMPRLRHALRPWGVEKMLSTLDEVTPASVRAAVRKTLARDHRVVVVTAPKVR